MHLFWGAWCYSDISHAFRWQLSAIANRFMNFRHKRGVWKNAKTGLFIECASNASYKNSR